MRTDPRAADVRTIVERVFHDFLRLMAERRAAVRQDYEMQESPSLGNVALARGTTGTAFPRLYDPAEECAAVPFEPKATVRTKDDNMRTVILRSRSADARPARANARSASVEIDETVLIDEGRYVARTYRTEGYMAMWLVAAGVVQFYDDRGRMLATINLYETLRPKRMAA